MQAFKRNQVEQAISRFLEPEVPKPSSELRTRIKRLLQADRSLGRTTRSADPERANYAFFSTDSPGRGVEIWFSQFEAFAILTALRLLEHGWPQGFVVTLLRRARADLERHHTRILKQDRAQLFDTAIILRNARPGDIAVENSDPVFLTIVSGEKNPKKRGARTLTYAVCRGQEEAFRFARQERATSWTMFELVTAAHSFEEQLSQAEPIKRGRSR